MQPGPIRPKLLDLFHAPTSQERERRLLGVSKHGMRQLDDLVSFARLPIRAGQSVFLIGYRNKRRRKGGWRNRIPPDSCPFTSDHGGLLPRRQDSPQIVQSEACTFTRSSSLIGAVLLRPSPCRSWGPEVHRRLHKWEPRHYTIVI